MKDPIIGKKIHDQAIDSLIDSLSEIVTDDASLYVGYPIATSVDSAVAMPALLISSKFGMVCFDVVPSARIADLEELKSRQKNIILPLKSKLLANPDLSRDFDLAFRVNVITFALNSEDNEGLIKNNIVSMDNITAALASCSAFPPDLEIPINAAIERVANIRPKSKRLSAVTANSKGSILKKIEREIANLDSWQKAAAIETPDGPQRIRGLAGSGKTIVLALKAAYLHGENPSWRIGVTFHTRALSQQLKSLTRRFYFEDYREDPDDSKLLIIHSFGSSSEAGTYSEICRAYGIVPRDFGYAKRMYGFNNAFAGICAELLRVVEKDPKIIFDALLIDEAQDMPKEFLRLAYLCTKDHRIVWAYDDLQNLGDYQMTSLKDTFGIDSAGNALVNLENVAKKPRQDIILPRCYRNTPWALVTAHALGSGIYRDPKMVQHPDDPTMVQHPDDPDLWTDIGYEVVDGDLQLGSKVVLKRSSDSSPRFFHEYLTSDDAVQFFRYEEDLEQFTRVTEMIKENIEKDELEPHDVAVVFPSAINAESRGMFLRRCLADHGITAHMVGVTSGKDSFVLEGSVAISGPYRAKGNEAPMIYVMDAEYCADGIELIKKRNILFTGITRSRGWVRITGVGSGMDALIAEFNKVKENNFNLVFKLPTKYELGQMRTLYRDITDAERKKGAEVKKLFEQMTASGVDTKAVFHTLPKEFRDQLMETLKNMDEF